MKITFYVDNINTIGGIETWLWHIGRIYGKNRRIEVYYQNGDKEQIERLKKFVVVRKFFPHTINCDVAVFCYTTKDDVIMSFNAKKERVQFIHACYSFAYKTKHYKLNPLIDRYIAVSQVAADDFFNISGYMPEVMYNPIKIDPPKKILHLISATRITEDKGSIWENMLKLAKKLDEKHIPYLWFVFTNNKKIKSPNKNIIFMDPELDISKFIADADYLVQLSKTEGYSYSVVESLILGTPVLCTCFPATKEIGVIDGENGYIFDMDLSNVDIEKIYNHIPKFNYEIRNSGDKWLDLLGEEHEIIDDMVWVRCCIKDGFTDMVEDKRRKFKEEWQVPYSRALELENFTNKKLIDIIE